LEGDVAAGARGVAGLQTGLEGSVASGVQAANQGISGLFNTQTGQVTALGQQVLQGLGLQFGSEAQAASILQALSQNPGWFQTAIGDIAQLGGAAGAVIGGINTGKGCWIAEAIYGTDDIRTHIVRAYLNGPFLRTKLGRLVMALYIKFGQSIASKVRKHDCLKRMFKPIFDKALWSALNA
jgi:hypothetical protein